MTIEYREVDEEQPLGYRAVYVSDENPLPVVMVGGGAGGSVTSDDVTVNEGTLTDYVTSNDAAVDAASKTATWGQVSNRPSTFTPSEHTHAVSDITGLQAIIDDLTTRIEALEAA